MLNLSYLSFCSLSLRSLLIYLFFSTVMPRFAEQVEVAIEALSTNPPQPFEENEFIDASRLVYDGVRDIRKAVLMIRVCSYLLSKSRRKTLSEINLDKLNYVLRLIYFFHQ